MSTSSSHHHHHHHSSSSDNLSAPSSSSNNNGGGGSGNNNNNSSSSSSSSSSSRSSRGGAPDIDKPFPNEAPHVTLTIRMIMNGKEVGSIIGKGGEIINNIREESGAKIHITDGSVPERMVTVTGPTESIYKSFTMICRKFEDDNNSGGGGGRNGGSSESNNVPKPPVTLRLIVPASQCGSLIGKGGSKIKEIREVTGASIQVASEMLPNSTERAVTISGTKDAITQCIYHVCCVMLESPPKGTTIPYSPKSGLTKGGSRNGSTSDNPLASLLGLGGSGSSALMAIATLASSQHHHRSSSGSRQKDDRNDRSSSQNHEMTIPNDSIGCIIGKGGSKIAEIRQISGAMIRISKSDNNDDNKERLITISGNADSVALAKSLINMSLDLHKSSSESSRNSDSEERSSRDHYHRSSSSSSSSNNNFGLGLAQLLSKPETLTALTSLASLTSLGNLGAGGLLGSLVGGGHHGSGGSHHNGQVTGVHRQRGGYSGGGGGGGRDGGSSRNRDEDRRDSKRSKFAPY